MARMLGRDTLLLRYALSLPLAGAFTSVVLVVLVTGAGTLTLGSAAVKPPPIPQAGQLARPKSLNQVGTSEEATRSAIPPDNPQTTEKIALGQKLFFDGRLSADRTVACSTCHDPARAFTDGRPTSIGIQGRVGQRNAPTILNALYNQTQFWDGRAKTLEDQAALPITNPVEMGQPDLEAAVASLAALPEYQQAFRAVFGRPPNAQDLVRALASYERTLTSFDSPFDRFLAGDNDSIRTSSHSGSRKASSTTWSHSWRRSQATSTGNRERKSSRANAPCPGRTVPTATRSARSVPGRRRRNSGGPPRERAT